MSRTTYTSSYRVGLKLFRKLEGFGYENAESQYPRRTIRPKIEPLAYVYAQLKKLNGSPDADFRIVTDRTYVNKLSIYNTLYNVHCIICV